MSEVAVDSMLDEVWAGLSARPKTLSPKFFYDTRGSELFEQITRVPEYYLTRTEVALLERWSPELVRSLGPGSVLELGAGSARKTRILLDALAAQRGEGLYVPVDVSGPFVEATAAQLEREYPSLKVVPHVADVTDPLELGLGLPGPTLFLLLGSTIGNFPPGEAEEILGHVRGLMGDGDRFLMGVDLRPGDGKSQVELEAAYNDRSGVTAEFNLNMLRVLNRTLGTDFDPELFEHRAFYDPEPGWIEMHLVALEDLSVTVPDRGQIAFRAGESVRTELSCKHDRSSIQQLFGAADLVLDRWFGDDRGRYALVLGRPS